MPSNCPVSVDRQRGSCFPSSYIVFDSRPSSSAGAVPGRKLPRQRPHIAPRLIVDRAPLRRSASARRPLVLGAGRAGGFEFHAARWTRADSAQRGRPRRRRLHRQRARRDAAVHGPGPIRTAEFPPRGWAQRRDDLFGPACTCLLQQIRPPTSRPWRPRLPPACGRSVCGSAGICWPPIARACRGGPSGFRASAFPSSSEGPRMAGRRRRRRRTLAGDPAGAPRTPQVEALEAVLGPSVLLMACTVAPTRRPPRCRPAAAGATPAAPAQPPAARWRQRRVVQDIKADAALCAAPAALPEQRRRHSGPRTRLDRQAVLVLGRDALITAGSRRCSCACRRRGRRRRPARRSPSPRARMLELLAGRRHATPAASTCWGWPPMLPLLLQCSVEETGDALRLPPDAHALQRHASPLGAHLDSTPGLWRRTTSQRRARWRTRSAVSMPYWRRGPRPGGRTDPRDFGRCPVSR